MESELPLVLHIITDDSTPTDPWVVFCITQSIASISDGPDGVGFARALHDDGLQDDFLDMDISQHELNHVVLKRVLQKYSTWAHFIDVT